MAFASTTTKYYHEYTGEDGSTYQWQIRERGWDNTAPGQGPVELVASGITHAKTRWVMEGDDEYGPIMGSETTVSFFDTSGDDVLGDMTTLGTGSYGFHKDYALAVLKDAALDWIGYMEPPDINVAEDGPTEISLTATDGLGRLKEFGYEDPSDAAEPHNGRARVTTVIKELLETIEFGTGFYTACELYPRKASGQLTASDDPLYNVYIDRIGLAVSRGRNGDLAPINRLDALRLVLSRFGLTISMSQGYWHIYNPHLYHGGSSFNRWEYDSAGAQQNAGAPVSFTHRITPSNEEIERTRARLGQRDAYNGVTVSYEHELAVALLQPDFTPSANSPSNGHTDGRRDPLIWTKGSANTAIVRLQPGDSEDDYAGFIARSETGTDSFPANGSALTTQIGVYTLSQTTKTTYRTGDSFDCIWEFKVLPNPSSQGANRNPELQVALQIRLDSGTPQYLVFDDDTMQTASWTTSESWLIYPENTVSSLVGGVLSQKMTTDTLPDNGTITVTLGPAIEASVRTDSGAAAAFASGGILWDNVQLFSVVGVGEYRGERTVTTNFLDGRDETRIKTINTLLGDGPANDSRGSITYSTSIADRTSDWEKGVVDAVTPSGDSIDTVLARTVLTSTNLPRPTHSASYETTASTLYPDKSLARSGNTYRPIDITLDWRNQSVDGIWYKASEQGFTDDLVTAIDSGPGSSVFSGNGSSAIGASILTRMSRSFFSEEGKRITRTTEGIPSGSGTASVAVEAIAEPLLQDGDKIVIIAPDLNFYKVQVSADQGAGATSISFEDPDSPGSNFNFPNEVLSGANIFFVEEALLTIARLGEQGFGVTVLGNDLGTINQTTSGTLESVNVTGWIATVASGSTVELQQTDGTYLSVTLTATAYRGATSIEFSSIAIDVTSGDSVKASGTVSRADFTVTANSISALLTNPADKIATLDTGATFVASKTNLDVDTSLTAALKAGDKILIYTAGGTVYKVTVDADVAAGATPIVLSTADGDLSSLLNPNDAVAATSVSGLRIDMDGIEVLNTHIYGGSWNGTVDATGAITGAGSQGWIITAPGQGEFSNLTVRGTLSSLEGTFTIGTGSITLPGAGTQEMVWDSDGLTYKLDTSPVGTAMKIGFEAVGGTDYASVYYDDDSFEMTVLSSVGNVNLTSAADIRLGAGSGDVIIVNTAGAFTWPTDAPGAGEVLTWNAGGALTWEAASGSGTVTSVISGAGSGIDVSLATTTPTLALNLDELGAGTIAEFSGVSAGGDSVNQAIGGINVGSFNDDGTYVTASTGTSLTFNDTEFQTVDGGTQTEYRQRTVTVSADGQVTSVGTFGAWQTVVVA